MKDNIFLKVNLSSLFSLFQGDTSPNEYLSGIPKEYLSKWSSKNEEESVSTVSDYAKNFVREEFESMTNAADSALDILSKDHDDVMAKARPVLEEAYNAQNIDGSKFLKYLEEQNENIKNNCK